MHRSCHCTPFKDDIKTARDVIYDITAWRIGRYLAGDHFTYEDLSALFPGGPTDLQMGLEALYNASTDVLIQSGLTQKPSFSGELALGEDGFHVSLESTGKTIGDVYKAKITNHTSEPIMVWMESFVAPFAQRRFVIGMSPTEVKPNSTIITPLEGICLEYNQPLDAAGDTYQIGESNYIHAVPTSHFPPDSPKSRIQSRAGLIYNSPVGKTSVTDPISGQPIPYKMVLIVDWAIAKKL